jgi:uncharacterized iron-regulated membrane protein
MRSAPLAGGWLVNPKRVWLRRAIFQVHLWTGLAIGLYVVVMSLTGSAVVFRGELGRALTPLQRVVPSGPRMPVGELTAIAQKLYPRFAVDEVRTSSDPGAAVEIVFRRANRYRDRVFDPYTGKDLGDRVRREPRSIEWLADLHDNLLGGEKGRTINGILAVAFTVLCLTGAVVWWPGVRLWRRSMGVRFRGSWSRIAWETHSAMGFWVFALLLLWAISGIYLAFPNPFYLLSDAIEHVTGSARAADWANNTFSEIAELHFGRFAGTWTKVAYVVLGLVPAALFVTGFVMWWARKIGVRRVSARVGKQLSPSPTG